jgi:hypothetical protein
VDWADDLRFAQQAGVCVDATMKNGERYFTGIHEVDEESETASLYGSTYPGDVTSTRRINLRDIASVVVTKVAYPSAER